MSVISLLFRAKSLDERIFEKGGGREGERDECNFLVQGEEFR